jgi:UDP-N-acetylglucosamine 2-epimerase
MLEALERLVAGRPEARVDFLVHPNPNVQKAVHARTPHPRIRLLEPQPYPAFVRLLARCAFVITDSGGLQEEAAALGKPVLVARDATERPELIAAGGGLLVGRETAAIAEAAARLFDDAGLRRRMSAARNPFGDGRAGERIAGLIAAWLRER